MARRIISEDESPDFRPEWPRRLRRLAIAVTVPMVIALVVFLIALFGLRELSPVWKGSHRSSVVGR